MKPLQLNRSSAGRFVVFAAAKNKVGLLLITRSASLVIFIKRALNLA